MSRATLPRRPSLASDETKGELARLCLATTVERVMPMMSGSMKVACGAVTSTGASVGAACGGHCGILNFETRKLGICRILGTD